jgi:MoxR-like ATPase
MLARWGQITRAPALKAVSSAEELLGLRSAVDQIHLSPAIEGYILALVRGTRALTVPDDRGYRLLTFGASPRASLALYTAGRALAWLRGQDFVGPAIIQDLAPDVLRHRVALTYEAEAADQTADKIIAQVIDKTPVPSA